MTKIYNLDIDNYIDVELSKKIRYFLLGALDENITVEEVINAFNSSKEYHDISNFAAVRVSIKFPVGVLKYVLDFKELYSKSNMDEQKLKAYLKEVLDILQSSTDFVPKVSIDDLSLQKGWKTIYNFLFEGFTYQIAIRIVGNGNKYSFIDSYLTVNITSDKITVLEDERFKDGFNYSIERLDAINKVFQEAISYIRERDLFVNKISSRKKTQ